MTRRGQRSGSPGATGDRAETEGALEDAALRLLRRNGVLEGINLRVVADEAGVNRGLVYHYFGGRRDLLRAALRRGVGDRLRAMSAAPQQPFVERAREHIRMVIEQAEAIWLVIVLLLDGDDKVRILPLHDVALADLEARVRAGELRDDVDLVALHVYRVSAGYGYALLRERMADELGIGTDELDRRVVAVAGTVASVARRDGGHDQDVPT